MNIRPLGVGSALVFRQRRLLSGGTDAVQQIHGFAVCGKTAVRGDGYAIIQPQADTLLLPKRGEHRLWDVRKSADKKDESPVFLEQILQPVFEDHHITIIGYIDRHPASRSGLQTAKFPEKGIVQIHTGKLNAEGIGDFLVDTGVIQTENTDVFRRDRNSGPGDVQGTACHKSGTQFPDFPVMTLLRTVGGIRA